jgi:hypothetical protein
MLRLSSAKQPLEACTHLRCFPQLREKHSAECDKEKRRDDITKAWLTRFQNKKTGKASGEFPTEFSTYTQDISTQKQGYLGSQCDHSHAKKLSS